MPIASHTAATCLLAVGLLSSGAFAAVSQTTVAERLGNLTAAKSAYIEAQSGRADLRSALSGQPGLALDADAADLLLREALVAEEFYARKRPSDLPAVREKTRLALVDFLGILNSAEDEKLVSFATVLARRWGTGALLAPRRNVYGRLRLAVSPDTVNADVTLDRRPAGSSAETFVLLEGPHHVKGERSSPSKSCAAEVQIAGGKTKVVPCDLR